MSKSSRTLDHWDSGQNGAKANTTSQSFSGGDSSDEYGSDLHYVIEGVLQQHQLLQQRNDLYLEQLAAALSVSN